MNNYLFKTVDELRDEISKLLKIIDGLVQERGKQDRQVKNIQEELVNEKLANKQVLKQLNES